MSKKQELIKEIEKKKESLDVVRENRIAFSKRMKEKDKYWNVTFFMMNFSVISLFVATILNSSIVISSIAGIYSIYVILLHYMISKFNHHEKFSLSTRNQLLIEHKISLLKSFLRDLKDEDTDLSLIDEISEKFMRLYEEYVKELEFFPNHESIDSKVASIDRKIFLLQKPTKEAEKKIKKYKISPEKLSVFWLKVSNHIFIFLNTLLSIVAIIYGVWVIVNAN